MSAQPGFPILGTPLLNIIVFLFTEMLFSTFKHGIIRKITLEVNIRRYSIIACYHQKALNDLNLSTSELAYM